MDSDKGLVFAGTAQGEIVVVDARTLRRRSVLRGHSGSVKALALFPDRTRLVSSSSDRSLRFWRLEDSRELMTLRMDTPVTDLAIDPGGERLAVGRASGIVSWLDAREERQRVQERLSDRDSRPAGAALVAGLGRNEDSERLRAQVLGNESVSEQVKHAALGEVALTLGSRLERAYDLDRVRAIAWPAVRRRVFRDLYVSDTDDDFWPDFTAAAKEIRARPDLSPETRDAAAEFSLALNFWAYDDPQTPGAGHWNDQLIREVVLKGDSDPEECALALFSAEALNEVAPHDERYAEDLGFSRYRVGLYGEAIDVIRGLGDRDAPGAAERRAFLTMASARLGDDAGAAESLRRCDQALGRRLWREETSARALTSEAHILMARPVSERRRPAARREDLEAIARRLDVGSPDALPQTFQLGSRYLEHGRPDRAESLFRSLVKRMKGEYGEHSPEAARATFALAQALEGRKNEEAEREYRDTLARFRVLVVPRGLMIHCLQHLAHLLEEKGQAAEATRLREEAQGLLPATVTSPR